MTANILTILCPVAAALSSLQSLSADGLMPASVIRSPSVKFTKHVVFSKSCDSGSTATLKAFWFRKSTVCYRICSLLWDFSHLKESSATASKKLRSSYDKNCLAENYIQFRKIREEKFMEYCV